jgi:aldose sugar dehydrogenase
LRCLLNILAPLRARLGTSDVSLPFTAAWTLAAAAAVVALPLRVADGLTFWNGPAADAAYSLTMVSTFFAYALLLALVSRRPGGLPLLVALVMGAVCYTAGVLFLDGHPYLRGAGSAAALASAGAFPLAVVPYVIRRWRLAALGGLTVVVAALIGVSTPEEPRGRALWTQLEPLTLTTFAGLLPSSPMDGGGIAVSGDGLLVITGDGILYRVVASGDEMRATPVPIEPPMNRAQYLEGFEDPTRALRLRVTDLLAEPGDTGRFFVAHQYWDAAKRCFTIRVSWANIDQGASRWTPAFDSWPCLSTEDLRDDSETGGSLAWAGGRLLLTIGDHGRSGHDGLSESQGDDSAFGKVVEINLSGSHRIFTKGHRNAQGILVDSRDRIWVTEHGPNGGDELNLLEAGRNYGWPFATYGAEYGAHFWPLAPAAHDHGSYTEPVWSFVPSIAISSLIEVSSPLFPRWNGDLLIASLRSRTLQRMRLRESRPVYVEPIAVGYEIRDLVQGPDGRIFLWTDDRNGDLLALAPAAQAKTGPAAFLRCGVCHESSAEGPATAPSLRGVLGRRVASGDDYTYSAALTGLGGEWTEERLDAFLKDPSGYAPGSQMAPGKVEDETERRAIVEFLKGYR